MSVSFVVVSVILMSSSSLTGSGSGFGSVDSGFGSVGSSFGSVFKVGSGLTRSLSNGLASRSSAAFSEVDRWICSSFFLSFWLSSLCRFAAFRVCLSFWARLSESLRSFSSYSLRLSSLSHGWTKSKSLGTGPPVLR